MSNAAGAAASAPSAVGVLAPTLPSEGQPWEAKKCALPFPELSQLLMEDDSDEELEATVQPLSCCLFQAAAGWVSTQMLMPFLETETANPCLSEYHPGTNLTMPVSFMRRRVAAILDTGSVESIVNPRYFPFCTLPGIAPAPPKPYPKQLDGAPVIRLGVLTAIAQVNGLKFVLFFAVVSTTVTPLFRGLDFNLHARLNIDADKTFVIRGGCPRQIITQPIKIETLLLASEPLRGNELVPMANCQPPRIAVSCYALFPPDTANPVTTALGADESVLTDFLADTKQLAGVVLPGDLEEPVPEPCVAHVLVRMGA